MRLIDIKPIKEGGAALADAGVTRIGREDIPKTVELVSRASGIAKNKLIPLGSVGKQATSGDIDLAVDINANDPQKVHQRMIQALGGDDFGVYNPGNKIGSYAVPIGGDPKKGMVQVDLMYVPNTKWAEFAYFSPGEKSKYKGAIRGILLAAAAGSLDEPGVDAFVYDDKTGDLLVRAGRGINPNVGLKRMNQMRGKHKKTGAWLKTMKNVTPEDIKREFPDLEFQGDAAVVDDPNEVVQILFGIGVTPKDVDSAEEIIDIVKRTFPKKRADQFFKHAAGRAAPLADKMEIPPELQEHM